MLPYILTLLLADTILGGALATLLSYMRIWRMLITVAGWLGIPMLLPTVAALLRLAQRLHALAWGVVVLVGALLVLWLAAWVWCWWWSSEVMAPGATLAAVANIHAEPPTDPFHEILFDSEGEHSNASHNLEALRLRTGKAGKSTRAFMHHWVSALRCEFPLRADRPSDRAAMSAWLYGKMRERGMRYTHIADCTPKIVALALQKSRAEVEAEQMADVAKLRTTGQRWWRGVRVAIATALGFVVSEVGVCNPEYPK